MKPVILEENRDSAIRIAIRLILAGFVAAMLITPLLPTAGGAIFKADRQRFTLIQQPV